MRQLELLTAVWSEVSVLHLREKEGQRRSSWARRSDPEEVMEKIGWVGGGLFEVLWPMSALTTKPGNGLPYRLLDTGTMESKNSA
jgi:hypothetical protein